MDLPNKKYDLIVIDPPWNLRKLSHDTRPNQIDFPYETMTLDDIKAMDIKSLAKDQCWLFMWTTQKYLFESKAILEGWGFKFLMTQVWEKTFGISSGMALYGFRWNAEFILVGYIGKAPSLWVKNKPLIPLVFQAENIKHSRKPCRFYNMIADLGEDKIDIFARSKREGWDVWGNEVDDDEIKAEKSYKNYDLF